jgi:hypothetical protein
LNIFLIRPYIYVKVFANFRGDTGGGVIAGASGDLEGIGEEDGVSSGVFGIAIESSAFDLTIKDL